MRTDGDYTVWHKVQTTDGREAEVTKTVQVRTHDVAITKFTVPKSASAGQTRQIVVGLRNYNYTEDVQVELYKSGVYGYLVGRHAAAAGTRAQRQSHRRLQLQLHLHQRRCETAAS